MAEQVVDTSIAEESKALAGKAIPLAFVKAYYFALFCYLAHFARYLTLYFEHDGLSPSQIGMLWSVYRVIPIVVTPFAAALADKTKRARTIMQCSLSASIVAFFGLAIPLPEGSHKVILRAAALWIFGLCGSPSAALSDALAIAACEQDSERWGQARVYGAIGWGLMHLFLGPLMDTLGFSVLFVSFFCFACVLLFVQRMGLPQSCGVVKKEVTPGAVMDIFSRNKLFFVNIAVVGAGFSMVEGMLFLLLQELGASNLLCGLAVVVTVIFELPIFHYAKPLIRRLGTKRMILLGEFAWILRALFYANMTMPWTVLLIEPLHGVTFALVWTAATQHVADPAVSGEGLEASAQGLLQTCFMGVGPFFGLAVGGWLFEHVGSHAVYGIFCGLVLVVTLVYAMFGGAEASSYGTPDPLGDGKDASIGKPSAVNLSEGDAIIDDLDFDGDI